MSTIFVFVQVSYDFEPSPAGPVAPDAPTACGCMACDGQASISSPPARLPCILLPCSPQPAACSPQPSAMQPAARCPANASRCPTSPYPASCCLATRYLAARSLLPSTVAYVAQEGPPNAAPSAFGWPAIARWGPQMPPLNANGQRWPRWGPQMALLLFMTCCDQVGTPRSPRYLRVASDGQVGAPRCPLLPADGLP